jgi:hypothetical protein
MECPTEKLELITNKLFEQISKLHRLEQIYIAIKLSAKINGEDDPANIQMLEMIKKELKVIAFAGVEG